MKYAAIEAVHRKKTIGYKLGTSRNMLGAAERKLKQTNRETIITTDLHRS